jgi:regulator of sigma D
MQDSQLFEYAVIRIVPRVEREEFLNVGVIIYCAKQKFLQAEFKLNKKRISHFCEKINVEEVEEHLKTFEKICRGVEDSGPIGQLSIAERFRWLTATRSTIIQTSKVHPGFTKDAKKTLQKLLKQLVL